MTATRLHDRSLVRVGGGEARAFLQGLLTQDVLSLAEGEARWGALLTPQGKALFDLLLWGAGEDVLIDCEAAVADALVRRLTLYRLRRAVTIAPEPERAVHWSLGPRDGASADPRLADLGYRWLGAPGGEDASEIWRAHRLSLGVTEGQAELGQDQTLWLECNAREFHGVDFAKGCYVGQENTARMHYRHKIGRRLVVLPLDRSDPARRRAAYPALGLAVDWRRVEDLAGLPLPGWLAAALGRAPA
jgi:hypothetical protein